MVILLRLTHPWCPAKSREITPRIRTSPLLFFFIVCICENGLLLLLIPSDPSFLSYICESTGLIPANHFIYSKDDEGTDGEIHELILTHTHTHSKHTQTPKATELLFGA